MAIDFTIKRLFWVDARRKTLESCNLNGTNHTIVLNVFGQHPFSVTIFEDYAYWTDWATETIHRANKFNGKSVEILQSGLRKPMGISIFHAILQPAGMCLLLIDTVKHSVMASKLLYAGSPKSFKYKHCQGTWLCSPDRRSMISFAFLFIASNPCIGSYCSHLCLFSHKHNYRCACPTNYQLLEDGHICNTSSKWKFQSIAYNELVQVCDIILFAYWLSTSCLVLFLCGVSFLEVLCRSAYYGSSHVKARDWESHSLLLFMNCHHLITVIAGNVVRLLYQLIVLFIVRFVAL